ncbi:hypothetical protein M514_24283 [Trichuris suis]|uniref:Uncharacterized protein n=1 Tax=Trichuris suis TaxID=68888 RepID=A0A085N274_9BILA|nr:hypothetical protein M514_24283 [Trichuris suis]
MCVKRSKYRAVNTAANSACERPDMPKARAKAGIEQLECAYILPAHERDFQIFTNNTMMAKRWERSPARRKMFMVPQGPTLNKNLPEVIEERQKKATYVWASSIDAGDSMKSRRPEHIEDRLRNH